MKFTPINTPVDWAMLAMHPFCEAMPMIDSEQITNLAKSMEFGWDERHPVVLFEDMVLDGRGRLHTIRTFKNLKVRPTFVQFEGTPEEALRFVFSENVARRQMTKSQIALAIVACDGFFFDESGFVCTLRTECANTEQIKTKKTGLAGVVGDLAHTNRVSERLLQQARELKEIAPDRFAEAQADSRAPSVGTVLRKIKGAPAAKPPPLPPRKDEAGAVIHPRARAAITDGRGEFKSMLNQLRTVKRALMAIAKEPLGRELRVQELETDFKNIERQITNGAPYSSCPLDDPCDESCKLCRGTQWITEAQYRGLPERFRKGHK